MPARIAAELGALVDDDPVLVGHDVEPYLTDATEAESLRGTADAVVIPSSTDRLAAVVEWCHHRGVAVVPRGGGTGYSGGCVPDGGVVVSTESLRAVRSFDPLLWRIEVEAGVTTRDVQRLARENGLLYPVDPGAAEQSRIGGNVATNAGGPHAFKYGVTGSWVTGLEAVVPPGEVIRIGGAVRKDVAGYDLRSLLVGSEGTLGVITSVSLRLIPAVEARYPVVGVYSDAAAASAAVVAAMASGTVPSAIEFLDEVVTTVCGWPFRAVAPPRAGMVVIAEADGCEAEARRGRSLLIEAMRADAAELFGPDTAEEVAELWRWREGVGIAVDAHLGGKMSEDICVPVDRLAEAIERTVQIGRDHDLSAGSWGHAGDGNLHSTFMFERDDPVSLNRAREATAELFSMAVELGGTISGEHGLGRIKSGFLREQWSPLGVRMHRGIKELFDPSGIMNPGKKLA